MLKIKHEQLPDWCYVAIPSNPPGEKVGRVKWGHTGYWPAPEIAAMDDDDACRQVRMANAERGVTPLQELCMSNGSLFGWDVPGADPDWVREHLMPFKDETDKSAEASLRDDEGAQS